MYSVQVTAYGLKLVFGDFIKVEEANRWLNESDLALARMKGPFGAIIDMRSLKPLLPEVQAIIGEGQAKYREMGMERSVVILNNPLITSQFKRIAKDSGIFAYERYIDASATPDWERIALAWVTEGIEPIV